jgi:iron-sulfur cluster repair protein YtfE (RIC family)
VHFLILEQHRELRRLLALGVVQICALSRGQSTPAALRELLGEFRTAFVAHLSYEEAALLPLFDDERLAGQRRTQLLREEHASQRREIETLHALSEAGSSDAFAERFDRLARALLVDIAEEERQLTRVVAIFDDGSSLTRKAEHRPSR